MRDIVLKSRTPSMRKKSSDGQSARCSRRGRVKSANLPPDSVGADAKEYRNGDYSDTCTKGDNLNRRKTFGTTKTASDAEQRLLPTCRCLDRRRKGDRQEGADIHGDHGPADHQ